MLWNLSFWQNLPQIVNLVSPIARGKFVERNLEQIQVERCQPYICVQLQLGANFALTAKYYSPREISSASQVPQQQWSSQMVCALELIGPRIIHDS